MMMDEKRAKWHWWKRWTRESRRLRIEAQLTSLTEENERLAAALDVLNAFTDKAGEVRQPSEHAEALTKLIRMYVDPWWALWRIIVYVFADPT
jgi:hypothetical protein